MIVPIPYKTLLRLSKEESGLGCFMDKMDPEKLLHTICAFANDIENKNGGWILVQTEKEEAEKTKELIEKICRQIQPEYHPYLYTMNHDGKYAVCILASAGFDRPYRESGFQKAEWIRLPSETLRADKRQWENLNYICSSIPFDERTCFPADILDLSRPLNLDFLEKTESPLLSAAGNLSLNDLAETLGLFTEDPQRKHPSNGAILLFSEYPQKYFPGIAISVSFRKHPYESWTEQKRFEGPLVRMLENALGYIRKMYVKEKTDYWTAGGKNKIVENFPYEAIKDILVRAVCCWDFGEGRPINIEITPESLKISCTVRYYKCLMDKQGDWIVESKYRNRAIFQVFRCTGLIHEEREVFSRAKAALESNGSQPLNIQADTLKGLVEITIPVQPAFRPEPDKSYLYQKEILKHLEDRPASLTELAALMGYQGITARLRKNVRCLQRQKIIMAFADRDGQVRFRPFQKISAGRRHWISIPLETKEV